MLNEIHWILNTNLGQHYANWSLVIAVVPWEGSVPCAGSLGTLLPFCPYFPFGVLFSLLNTVRYHLVSVTASKSCFPPLQQWLQTSGCCCTLGTRQAQMPWQDLKHNPHLQAVLFLANVLLWKSVVCPTAFHLNIFPWLAGTWHEATKCMGANLYHQFLEMLLWWRTWDLFPSCCSLCCMQPAAGPLAPFGRALVGMGLTDLMMVKRNPGISWCFLFSAVKTILILVWIWD